MAHGDVPAQRHGPAHIAVQHGVVLHVGVLADDKLAVVAAQHGKDVEIPGTVNGIGYVSGKAGREIIGTQEYGTIHVVKVVVTLKNVSSRAVTLTADNFPAEIDNSAASPLYFGFADNASGDSWWTKKNYELQPNEETTFVLVYRISDTAYKSWFQLVHTVELTFKRHNETSPFHAGNHKIQKRIKTKIPPSACGTPEGISVWGIALV